MDAIISILVRSYGGKGRPGSENLVYTFCAQKSSPTNSRQRIAPNGSFNDAGQTGFSKSALVSKKGFWAKPQSKQRESIDNGMKISSGIDKIASTSNMALA